MSEKCPKTPVKPPLPYLALLLNHRVPLVPLNYMLKKPFRARTINYSEKKTEIRFCFNTFNVALEMIFQMNLLDEWKTGSY